MNPSNGDMRPSTTLRLPPRSYVPCQILPQTSSQRNVLFIPQTLGLPRVALSAYREAEWEAWEMADFASRRHRS